ncbi:hypothetical protein N8I77_012398 [Diaporthe amygdali]|uniref:Uncharacterized protein n=1 Tax=Phomopsis amygdali TaxID=1214568 RepID=A0AAD9S3Y2_PHOAM|nr:uncharacterized protein J7T55_000579 [Diaporthe amygdali]KAJ0110147.1 hypothetical protein J7T55_000579 [Diaporthe amygdali]KAK2597621.1 hypothetical protein N8I77_012398 [Diaporthe amygdali]
MPLGLRKPPTSLIHLSFSTGFVTVLVAAAAAPQPHPPPASLEVERRNSNPLGIDLSPAPPPDEGPAGAKYALRDPAYLPAQIGGIVGSYAFSLVLVAIILLSLSKRRREHLRAGENIGSWEDSNVAPNFSEQFSAFKSQDGFQCKEGEYPTQQSFQELPKIHTQDHVQGHVRNFSLPSPTSANFSTATREQNPYVLPSPDGSLRGQPGVDPHVNQSVVQQDRAMAQAQLEDMYKYVMEQEAAKEAGVEFRGPTFPAAGQQQEQLASSQGMLQKKGRNKPANLNLNGDAKSERTQSRTSSILSALKSPLGKKKEKVQAISISSPIMTPMTGTFPPQYAGEEMNAIPPRHYAPAAPPPVPAGNATFSQRRNVQMAPLTPPDDISPESTQSIDERLRAMAGRGKDRNARDEYSEDEEEEERQGQGNYYHSRQQSSATEADPISATSETSTTPLVRNERARDNRSSGLPTSPKPGVNRFPSLGSLPSSPKPGATFSRPNAPSAVRTGGALPLRAYEPALMSPNTYDRTVKQTVFERAGPLSPGMGTARTPHTGAPVPYSPYQPFSPVVPITPSLVTKADRKRMKRMEPKTPTLEMVQSSEDIW